MYALPRALERYRGLKLTGQVVYSDHVVNIPAEAVDEAFVRNMGQLINPVSIRDAGEACPQPRVSAGSARSRQSDCPERAEESPPEEGTTDDFLE